MKLLLPSLDNLSKHCISDQKDQNAVSVWVWTLFSPALMNAFNFQHGFSLVDFSRNAFNASNICTYAEVLAGSWPHN